MLIYYIIRLACCIIHKFKDKSKSSGCILWLLGHDQLGTGPMFPIRKTITDTMIETNEKPWEFTKIQQGAKSATEINTEKLE